MVSINSRSDKSFPFPKHVLISVSEFQMSSAVLQNLFGWFYRPHGEKSLAKKLNKMFSIISIGAQLHSGEE
jgi:hypothetical protein